MIKTGDPVVLKFDPRTREIKRYDGKVYAYESMENAQKYLKPGEKDAILMEYVPKPEWIPVVERKPDKELDEIAAVVNTELHWPGFQCLAMIRDAKYPTILNYADIDGDRVWVDDECNWYPVTHWMPLPKPPKEG